MSNKENSTQTAIKLRRSIDSLFGLLTTLHQYALETSSLRGRGTCRLSNNMATIITTISDMVVGSSIN